MASSAFALAPPCSVYSPWPQAHEDAHDSYKLCCSGPGGGAPAAATAVDPGLRAVALRCIAGACESGQLLVDVFVNFDCDLEGANLFERLVRPYGFACDACRRLLNVKSMPLLAASWEESSRCTCSLFCSAQLM